MTSHLIDTFSRRASKLDLSQNLDAACLFCQIVSGHEKSHKVYEDDYSIAILDIQPIRLGHMLVIPKAHVMKLSDLTPEIAGALGATVARVAHAICCALDITALNVVCNQEYAQAVPHVHYHIVPAPVLQNEVGEGETESQSMTMPSEIFFREIARRGDLDDSEGEQLSKRIKCRL
ncbi:HIT-like protein [Ceratobasidium sp. AG-I]|nr:HIT-like protein [Ceratobasidium sp. AG-I]